jgi:hypothetical protein
MGEAKAQVDADGPLHSLMGPSDADVAAAEGAAKARGSSVARRKHHVNDVFADEMQEMKELKTEVGGIPGNKR